MTPQETWRQKSDEEVAAAARQLGAFTHEDREIILAESQRRRLPVPELDAHDEGPAADEGIAPRSVVSEAELDIVLERLRREQSLARAVAGGGAAAAAGAILWAALTVATGYQIGWMALGVGWLVGQAVRRFGQGIDTTFGAAGALLAAAGCLTGNLLAACGVVANHADVGMLEVISRLDLTTAAELLRATFHPLDLLFYGLAIYEGYRGSFRRLDADTVARELGRA